jgi:charged multivesicular body protein 1
MGQPQSQQAKPIDMTDMLINMKMKSKMFLRESQKSEKEEKKQLEKAKLCLKKGNEEGAKLFCDLAQQKRNESLQYMKMGVRLEVIAGQIKSKTTSMEMMNSLNQFTPFLQQASAEMPLEQMFKNMDSFSKAYDDLVVKGHILDNTINNTLGEKGTVSNVDNMMNQLKAEVAYDMTGNVNMQDMSAQQQHQMQPAQQQNAANNDFYAQLKNL